MIAYNRIPAILAGARPKVEAALAKTAFDTQRTAQTLAPVDTGNLRGSMAAASAGSLRWRVTAAAEYSLYVELGTRKMAAQPYLVPALRTTVPKLISALRLL